jgi:hypothetical protein
MEQLQLQNESSNFLSEHNTQKMLHIYQMVRVDSLRESLAYLLLANNESYSIADKKAGGVVQQKTKTRSYYSGRSGKLMDYSFDENVDQSTDQVIINLLTVAINDYLSDKQEQPEKEAELNKVKVLMMQLIAKGANNILTDINIPPYMMSMVKAAEDKLDEGLDNVFNSWCMDLEETGNDHLVDWMRKEVGPAIFGLGLETKAKDKYEQYMKRFIGSINNPKELYDRYLVRRDECDAYVNKVRYTDLYEIFGITGNQFNKVQKKLFDDFQLRYSENTNAKYIKELLNG